MIILRFETFDVIVMSILEKIMLRKVSCLINSVRSNI